MKFEIDCLDPYKIKVTFAWKLLGTIEQRGEWMFYPADASWPLSIKALTEILDYMKLLP